MGLVGVACPDKKAFCFERNVVLIGVRIFMCDTFVFLIHEKL